MVKDTQVKGNYLEGLWNFFASVQLTVVILMSMALLSIIGTLIPQNEKPAEYLKAFGPFLYQVLSTLDIFDMYRSWWFQGLIIMMVINIVICSIDRLQVTGKVIFAKKPKFNLENYRRRKIRRDFDKSGSASLVRDNFKVFLSKQFRFCEVVPVDKGFAYTLEKGRLTRLGVYVVHLSIVVLLIGSLIGSLGGFEGFVAIDEGKAADTIRLRFSNASLKLPFSIKCEDFDLQKYDTGAHKEYRSTLTIIENGQSVLKKDIIVNDPLRYKGINIYQSSYGEIGNQVSGIDINNPLEFSIQGRESRVEYKITAAMNQPVELPEGAGHLIVERFLAEADFRGQPMGPSLVVKIKPKSGEPEHILLPLKFPKFDRMRQGTLIVSVNTTSENIKANTLYYTGLQVTKDPGVGMVYVGFILMILGCIVTFFMSHQQVVVEIQPNAAGVGVMVSGKTNKNKIGFQNKIERLSDKLAKLDTSR